MDCGKLKIIKSIKSISHILFYIVTMPVQKEIFSIFANLKESKNLVRLIAAVKCSITNQLNFYFLIDNMQHDKMHYFCVSLSLSNMEFFGSFSSLEILGTEKVQRFEVIDITKGRLIISGKFCISFEFHFNSEYHRYLRNIEWWCSDQFSC